jgi:glyoxylase-like metal-dependent hydrolase (beta-lactamase superfamily II)
VIVHVRKDLVGIRNLIVWHYLLLDGPSVVAIDTGLGHSAWRMRRWFQKTGRTPGDLKAIVLTHGHLDHAGCASVLQKWSGAPVYLHPADEPIARGEFPYHGWARVAGVLEAVGRRVTGYRPPCIDATLSDGQVLDYWGGLRVVHLPGHTPGHVGLYSIRRRILFAGDAICSRFGRPFLPPRIFNADHQMVRRSLLRLLPFDIEWIYPMHHLVLRHNLMDDIRRYAQKQKAEGRGE